MPLAVLCSGQGPQYPGMFELTANTAEAAFLFAHATTLLGGCDPREFARHGSNAAIHGNRVGQVLCTLQALAASAALRGPWFERRIVAGYSVGEVAAWGVAGWFEGKTTLDLVACRADAMDAHSEPGDGLLFVRGLSRETIDSLCKHHDTAVAIINPGDAYVIGGTGARLDALGSEATGMGATRVLRLAVEVASHTSRLAASSAEFRRALDYVPIQSAAESGVRLFSGVDATPVIDIETGKDKLAEQISSTVRWADCLQGCVEAGAAAFLELGPGRALSEMATVVCPGIAARSLQDFRSLRGARDWLGRIVR